MTDEEAKKLAHDLLSASAGTCVGPESYADIRELSRWVLAALDRIPKPRRSRNEYMRDYMRERRKKQLASVT